MKEKIIAIKVPQIGVNDQEAELIKWCVSNENKISTGDMLCTLETAKAVFSPINLSKMSFKSLLFEIRKRVASITLNRPDAANSLNPQMTIEMMGAVIHCDSDPGNRTV